MPPPPEFLKFGFQEWGSRKCGIRSLVAESIRILETNDFSDIRGISVKKAPPDKKAPPLLLPDFFKGGGGFLITPIPAGGGIFFDFLEAKPFRNALF